jgi:hypothetical protein
MSDARPDLPAARRGLPRLVATVVLGLLSALLAFQILGVPRAALGAFVGGAVVAHLAWGVLVMRPAGASIGGAAATGALTLVTAYVGAGLIGGGGARVIVDHEAVVMLIFTFWIVVPVMVAAAIGLAVLDRFLAGRT